MKNFRRHQLRAPFVSWAVLLGVSMGACGTDSPVDVVEAPYSPSNPASHPDVPVMDAMGNVRIDRPAQRMAATFDSGATSPEEAELIESTAQALWEPDSVGGHDQTGYSVAISSDGTRAIVGGNMATFGSAYVFERQGNDWIQKGRLFPPTWSAAQYAGFSVAIDGDTALMGTYAGDSAPGVVYVYVRSPAGVWPVLPTSQLLASDGEAGDYFGHSVSISGNTAIVGAVADDDKGVNSGSAYIFVRQTPNAWTQTTKLTLSEGAPYDQFGFSVAISGDIAVVGAYATDSPAFDSGSAYVFERTNGTWSSNYVQKLTASDRAVSDYFGFAAAIAGEKILIGAPGDDDGSKIDTGSAYLFVRDGQGMWPQTKKFSANDGAAGDAFGTAVAISGDIALVGAPKHDVPGANDGGATYAFVRAMNDWVPAAQMPKILSTSPSTSDLFGHAVAISGNHLLIGAPASDTTVGMDAGATYPFRWNGTSFDPGPRIVLTHGAEIDNFGFSVAISEDEKIAIVGAPYDDERAINSGSAYVFYRDSAGSAWPTTYETKLQPADGAANDQFGFSVGISGNTAVVGAPYDDDKGADSGSAYVFVRSPSGTWSQQAKLDAGDDTAYDNFGFSVGISGNAAVFGAPYDADQGSAHVFTRSNVTWSYTDKLLAGDGALYDQFGIAVGISGDTAVVGAHTHDTSQPDVGSAYVFERSPQNGTWPQKQILMASDAGAHDNLGRAVAISGDTIIAGAPNDDGRGSAYVFVRSPGGTWPPTQTKKLAASDGAASDIFGYTVAISGDIAAVGAPWDDNRAGSVYVFVRPTGGDWLTSQTDKLVASDRVAGNSFGVGLALSGKTIVAGAHLRWSKGPDSGAAYAFGLGRLTQGTPCGSHAQCATNYCVDGVCCDDPCTASCKACTAAKKKQGVDGTCGPILAGNAPKNAGACPTTDPDTCGENGFCDGEGDCQKWPAGTSCGSGQTSCNGNKAVGESCNGLGACTQELDGTDCAPNLCQSGACGSSCSTDAGCTVDAYCDPADNKCKFKRPLGTVCGMLDSACGSGHCVDGFCCNTPCDGTCQACSTEKKGSGANGYCGNAQNGTDPHDDCTKDPQNTCLLDGECNAGACRVYGFGTACGASLCADNVLKKQVCSGLGSCTIDLTGTDCQAHACDAANGICKTTCSTDTDCAPDAFCNAGTCKFDEALGATCSSASQCKSGFCVDGFCCDSACTGTCRTCGDKNNDSKKAGFCGNIVNGADPDDECPADAADTCNRDGTCNGSGSCRLHAAGTSCGGKTCGDAETLVSSQCNGSGLCIPIFPAVLCFPYACVTNACVPEATCDEASDCAPGAFCNGQPGSPGICTGHKAISEACSSDVQCDSGHCVDAVCCDSACTGACRACSAAAKGSGVDGECGNVAHGTDPHDDCTNDPGKPCGYTGECNEFGACAVRGYGESCGAAVCTAGLKYNSQICNGVGACVPNPSTLETCFPYVCAGATACKTACDEYAVGSSESDCVEGFDCRASQCVPITRTCTTIDDCNAGEVCDVLKNQCVPRPSTPPGEAPSCDCRCPGPSSSPSAWPLAFVALVVLRAMRNARRSMRHTGQHGPPDDLSDPGPKHLQQPIAPVSLVGDNPSQSTHGLASDAARMVSVVKPFTASDAQITN